MRSAATPVLLRSYIGSLHLTQNRKVSRMNMTCQRMCSLCCKEIHSDDDLISSNHRENGRTVWRFAHQICREAVMVEQQMVVPRAIVEIGSRRAYQ